MPRKEIDYSNTIIYKLCCKNPKIKDIYVGHTTDFTKRKCQHKSHCHNEKTKMYNYNVYKFIRDNGGFENWSMVMIEEYPCENKLQAEHKEREYIENLNATLNGHIPTRTHDEWYETNKGKINEIRNKKFECECGTMTNSRHQVRHRRTNKHLELMKLKTES